MRAVAGGDRLGTLALAAAAALTAPLVLSAGAARPVGLGLASVAARRLAAAAARLLRFGLAAATAPRDNPVKTAEVAWLHILRRSAACACRTTRHHDVERKQRADDPRFSAERACLQAGTLA